jgi:histidinol-phosphate aminotransferase
VTKELTRLGFEVLPSQTNFVLTRPPKLSAKTWLRRLRGEKILVRWFSAPEVRDYLRITIGTDAEAAALLRAVQRILTTTSNRARA